MAYAESKQGTALGQPCADHMRIGRWFAGLAAGWSNVPIGTRKNGPEIYLKASALDSLVDDINATGYGLTLGVHTRIEERAERICDRARVGNIYVNRNQIGAVVGVQPFGGEGLSGTGPKAGGPHYMHRFATERVVSVDTTASGGNAALMSLGSERGGKPQQ